VNGVIIEVKMKKKAHHAQPDLKWGLDWENAGKMKGTEWRG
jgi:hypothetical protein